VVGLNWDSLRQSPLTKTKILCGWAKLRFLSPIPFNQNQIPMCYSCWQGLNLLISSFLEFPNGMVLLIFLFYDKVWSSFSLDAFSFFLWFYKIDLGFSWLQGWYLSFLVVEINSIFLMIELENLVLCNCRIDLIIPDCGVNLQTLPNDRVVLLISLRACFSCSSWWQRLNFFFFSLRNS
jgi:hypothetical protein